MKFAILGSGAVGGYYGAKLVRAGHDVTFIARGAHLAAIRERGLQIRSPALGDFTVHAAGRRRHGASRPGRRRDCRRQGLRQRVGAAAHRADDRAHRRRSCRCRTASTAPGELAARFGEAPVVGGVTYIATALAAPGVIEQTGTHRRIVFGEVFGTLPRMTDRVGAIRDALAGRRHSGRGRRRRARADLGEVHLSRLARGFHRRVAPADRPALGRPGHPRAVPRQLPRNRTPRACRRRSGRHRHRGAHRFVRRRDSGVDAVVAADRSVAGEADRGRSSCRDRSCAARRGWACRCRLRRRCTPC